MKRIISFFLCVLMTAALLAGCGDRKQRTTWIIAVDGDFSPFVCADANGKAVGLDVELLDAIARDDRVCFTVTLREELVQDHATSLYESVVVLGRAALVTDQATHQAALAHLVDALGRVSPDLRDQYIARRGQNTAVLVIRPVHLTGKAKRDFRPIQQRM